MNKFTLSGLIRNMEIKYLHDFYMKPILRFILLGKDVCFGVVCIGKYASSVYSTFQNNEPVVVTGELKGYCFEDVNMTGHYCPFLFPVEIRSESGEKRLYRKDMEDTAHDDQGQQEKTDWIHLLTGNGISLLTEFQYSFLIIYGNEISCAQNI